MAADDLPMLSQGISSHGADLVHTEYSVVPHINQSIYSVVPHINQSIYITTIISENPKLTYTISSLLKAPYLIEAALK